MHVHSFNDWIENEFRVLYPKKTNGMVHNPATITPPTALNPLSPPPMRHSGKPKAVTDSEVEEYLKNPQTLLGKQFLHAPPVGVEQDYKGLWEADSYSVRMLDGRIDYEFLVRGVRCGSSADGYGRHGVPLEAFDVGGVTDISYVYLCFAHFLVL